MIKEKVLIFGSTGQIGRHLIRKLTKNNYKVTCQTRNSHKAIFLKTSGSIGYIEIVEANIFDEKKLNELIKDCDVCINLIGILYETSKLNSFKNIHTNFPELISKICAKNQKKLIHFSALGLEKAKDSLYANSKINGEKRIRENLSDAVIIKPSLVFSVSDSLTTKFLSLISNFPIFPMYYNGETKFCPIHASEIADLIYYVISNKIKSKDIEAIGPEILTFKEIIKILSESINKKILLINFPLVFAKFSASFFQLFPRPLITKDQLRLLKYDNIKSRDGITNFDIGCPSKINLKSGLKKYSYNWMDGGQYALKNSNKGKNDY